MLAANTTMLSLLMLALPPYIYRGANTVANEGKGEGKSDEDLFKLTKENPNTNGEYSGRPQAVRVDYLINKLPGVWNSNAVIVHDRKKECESNIRESQNPEPDINRERQTQTWRGLGGQAPDCREVG